MSTRNRDYSSFIDNCYIHNDDIVPCLKSEIEKIIKEDTLIDAVENIIKLFFTVKYEIL